MVRKYRYDEVLNLFDNYGLNVNVEKYIIQHGILLGIMKNIVVIFVVEINLKEK